MGGVRALRRNAPKFPADSFREGRRPLFVGTARTFLRSAGKKVGRAQGDRCILFESGEPKWKSLLKPNRGGQPRELTPWETSIAEVPISARGADSASLCGWRSRRYYRYHDHKRDFRGDVCWRHGHVHGGSERFTAL